MNENSDALRQRIADRLHAQLPGCEHDEHGANCEALADAVLAEPAPPADRAAVLREGAVAVAALDRRKTVIQADTIRDAWEEGRDEGADLLRRMADEAQPTPTPAVDLPTLAAALDGLHTLIATSSRDWQTYRVDAWLWAVLCGWDCEQAEHDETCTHGALEETAAMHGWDAATMAKARRYRVAVRALIKAHGDEMQPTTQTPGSDRVVAHVLATHTDLHCLRCAPPPHGDIWTPVTAEELEDGGVCARCGADVLIPQAAAGAQQDGACTNCLGSGLDVQLRPGGACPHPTHTKGQPMTATHTRTHVFVTFANPYLRCNLCHAWVTSWHNNDKCGCTEECWLKPCSHNAEAVSACPSWSPVDGCLCQQYLGRVDHGEPPANGGEPGAR